jgi:hypothetical protein
MPCRIVTLLFFLTQSLERCWIPLRLANFKSIVTISHASLAEMDVVQKLAAFEQDSAE